MFFICGEKNATLLSLAIIVSGKSFIFLTTSVRLAIMPQGIRPIALRPRLSTGVPFRLSFHDSIPDNPPFVKVKKLYLPPPPASLL